MKGALIIIFLTILAVTLAQQPFWVATLTAKCQSSGEKSCCLGAIISDDCLITAASCFSHCAQNDSFSVKATALQYSTSGKSMRIKVVKDGITIYPDYATSQAADLALVKFETPEFALAKATITDNCRLMNKADDLSVINFVNKKTVTKSPIQKDENKKCKDIYKPNWQGSTQTCFSTTACAKKPGSFIEGNNTLYAMTTFGCMQGSNTIAALSICKYYEWINDQFTTPTGPTSQSTTPTSKPTNPPTTPSTTPGCPPPLEIQNGVVQYDSTTDGSVARYQCNEGYTMKGNKKIKCVGIEWNRNPPKCASSQPTKPPTTPSTQQPTPFRLPQPVPMCNNPPTVSKALIDIPDTLEEGAVATYTCATRYGLVGDKQLTCKNGKWTGVVPSCQDCPPFKLRNGNFRIVETSVFLYATNLKCNKGYQLNGGGVNYCEHGKWKFPLQMCTIKQCPIPEDIPIGSVRHNNPPVHGSLAVYSCPTGYAVSGFQKRLCSDGKWEGFPPKCVSNKKHCPQYESLQCGTTSNSGGTKAGATVTYTPLPNFMLIGSSVITCQPNGTWSSPMPKCRRMCPMDFNLENGDHELIMDDMKIEYDMILTCDKGFIMKGLKQFTCTELGVWNRIPSQTKCDKVCTCLDVNNGDATCQEIGDFLFAYVTCKRGYKLQGSSPAICEKGAYFSTPKCVRK